MAQRNLHASQPGKGATNIMAVKEGWRGRFYEDFDVGDTYEHPLGRTITTTDNIWFTLGDAT